MGTGKNALYAVLARLAGMAEWAICGHALAGIYTHVDSFALAFGGRDERNRLCSLAQLGATSRGIYMPVFSGALWHIYIA